MLELAIGLTLAGLAAAAAAQDRLRRRLKPIPVRDRKNRPRSTAR